MQSLFIPIQYVMKIKIGDNVMWRGCWGTSPPKLAKVTGIELTDAPEEKYGTNVNEVDINIVKENRVVFHLDNNKWCYGFQVEINVNKNNQSN